jgi:hypothetical protein
MRSYLRFTIVAFAAVAGLAVGSKAHADNTAGECYIDPLKMCNWVTWCEYDEFCFQDWCFNPICNSTSTDTCVYCDFI